MAACVVRWKGSVGLTRPVAGGVRGEGPFPSNRTKRARKQQCLWFGLITFQCLFDIQVEKMSGNLIRVWSSEERDVS